MVASSPLATKTVAPVRAVTVFSRDTKAKSLRALGRRGAVFVVYAVLLVGAAFMFKIVPAGFIPTQDKLYLIAGVKMPEGASIERTDTVLKKMATIANGVEGVQNEVAFPGLNPLQFTNTPNNGVVFFTLKPFSERSRSA